MRCEVDSTRDTISAISITANENKKLRRQRNAVKKYLSRKNFFPKAVLINSEKIFDRIEKIKNKRKREFLKPKHFLIKRCDVPFCYCKDRLETCKPLKSFCKKFYIKEILEKEERKFYIRIKVDKKCGCENSIESENNKDEFRKNERNCLEIQKIYSISNYTVSIG